MPTKAGHRLEGFLPPSLRSSLPSVSVISVSNLWIKSSACHPFCWWNSQDSCRENMQSLGVQHHRDHFEKGLGVHRVAQPQKTAYPVPTERW